MRLEQAIKPGGVRAAEAALMYFGTHRGVLAGRSSMDAAHLRVCNAAHRLLSRLMLPRAIGDLSFLILLSYADNRRESCRELAMPSTR